MKQTTNRTQRSADQRTIMPFGLRPLLIALCVVVLLLFTTAAAVTQTHWRPLLVGFTAKVQEKAFDFAYNHSTLAANKAQAAVTTIHSQHPKTSPLLVVGSQTNGPLRVSVTNPRYFADANGNVVYLTGSHTWSNFQDNGGSDPPPRFDYVTYLDFLEDNHHNFFRLWTWEESRWTTETSDDDYWFSPAPPFARTGPGLALDGKAKFDLNQLDQAYFDRLRARVLAAQERGIYVAIILFNGWSIAASKGGFESNNPWQGHPFNGNNNINQIDGDGNGDNSGEEVHTLATPAITAIQEGYVRKVIDTVSDLDNVLYEISNESDGSSTAWQYHMINLIKAYEATKPQQHPVGMTVEYWGGDNDKLFDSPADWISPNGPLHDPMTGDGRKVILHDTDHLCGICGDRAWVWMAFTRGLNPIFMDGYDGAGYGVGGAGFDFNSPTWVSLRSNLGYTRQFAQRLKLAQMTPQNDLASTGYCLAHAAATDAAYLVYLPAGGAVTVDLTAAMGGLIVEWFDPETGATRNGEATTGGAERTFTAPFDNDAVLYIYQTLVAPTVTPTAGPTAKSTLAPTVTATPTLMTTVTANATPTATPCIAPIATPVLVGTPKTTPIPTVALTPVYSNYLPLTQQC